MKDGRLYRVQHRGMFGMPSKFRGRVVRLLTRPSGKPGYVKNVLAECMNDGERFVCPFRGLRLTDD